MIDQMKITIQGSTSMFFDLDGMTVVCSTHSDGKKELTGFYMDCENGQVSLWGRTVIGGVVWIADYADGMGYVVSEVPL